ncbi:polyphosphate-selective porin O [Oceanicaulis sp. HTCC2633]|uniref:OprO/OprP family phosphate-selective porin n=1 Tax=Oceanicaulis sp. HTCC2633 TaxID=314254 RepID=UPI000066A12A|nr:porin [Oceanicaulis sp. HTCC2633]EAP90258.1 polyphosphate-selective porin O [Oceanicaulis sp. HTCC2633]
MRKFNMGAAMGAVVAVASFATPAYAEDEVTVGDRGLEIEIGDEALDIRLGGKIQFDGYTYDDGIIDTTSADFRRARPDLRIRVANVLSMRAEWEFAGSKGWRNLYAQLEPIEDLTIRGGNFTVPFGMEDVQASARIPFAERSLVSAITPGFGLGGQVGYSGRRFTVKAGYFDDALDTERGRSPERGEGFSARATFLPIDHRRTKLHIGLGFETRDFDATETLRYSATAGTAIEPDFLTTTRLRDINSLQSINGELAFISHNLAFQGQYVHQEINRDLLPDVSVSGGYAQGSWMITGERYRYSRGGGTVSGPRLRNMDGIALELAGRFSWLDAGDVALGGQTAEAIDISGVVHLTPYARVMLTGTKAWWNDELNVDRDLTSGLVRLQLNF